MDKGTREFRVAGPVYQKEQTCSLSCSALLLRAPFLAGSPVNREDYERLVLCRSDYKNKGFFDGVNTYTPGPHSVGKGHPAASS